MEIKICGITTPEQAIAVAELGADAIGLVFFPQSPRNVSVSTAREITTAVKGKCCTCGVFVNMNLAVLQHTAAEANLDMLQLHGDESAEYIRQLKSCGKRIIKVLKKDSFASEVQDFPANAFLLELGKGALPGGNFQSWQWQKAEEFGLVHPYILAGGITQENILRAITQGNPQAIDVSSAVEQSPGIKDLSKVKKIIELVHSVNSVPHKERIFR